MLILTRHPGQSLALYPQPSLDPGTTVEQVFVPGSVRVEVLAVQENQVRLGVALPVGLAVRCEEGEAKVAISPLFPASRQMLARKLKVLMLLKLHSINSLAFATGLSVDQVRAATSGEGPVGFAELQQIAWVLGVTVLELFLPPGRTAAERVIVALLEGE